MAIHLVFRGLRRESGDEAEFEMIRSPDLRYDRCLDAERPSHPVFTSLKLVSAFWPRARSPNPAVRGRARQMTEADDSARKF